MTYQLHHGDCLDILPTLAAGSVDVVITDPPYGNKKYETDIEFDPALLIDWVRRYRTVAIFGYPELLVKWCGAAQVVPDEWVTWWPTNKVDGRGLFRLPKESESVAIFGEIPGAAHLKRPRVQDATCIAIVTSRGNSTTEARMGDVWRDAAPGMMFNSHLRQHPNEKPLSLMEKLIILCTNEGETVLDPYMGSGTTGEACLNTGRHFIGIEKDEGYFDVATRRLEAAAAQLVQLEMAV